MKGFILLGALSVLSLAVLVKDAKAESVSTSASSLTTESITSDMSTTAATSTDTSKTDITSTDISITTANNSTAETDITTANNSTTVTTQTTPDSNTTTTTNPPGGNTCSNSSICGDGAECVQLYDSHICRCPLTQSYNNISRSCEKGYGVFGELTLQGRNFSGTTSSPEYADVYNEVMQWFRGILEPEYENYTTTDIERLSAVSSRRRMRSSEVEVKAAVTNVFSSSVSPNEVNRFIQKKAVELGFGYESRGICDFTCDTESTSCRASADGQSSVCVCLEGHFRSTDTCSSCSVECRAENHQGCVWNAEKKVTDCQCLAGYKDAANGGCKACDFGYSGQDCKDNFLLILVIVGSVAGGVIIALLGAVIGITVRSSQKKKDNERTELLPTDRKSGSPSPVAGNLFPKVRVKADQGHVNTASNLYEEEQYARSFPQRDYDEDDSYEMSQPQRRY